MKIFTLLTFCTAILYKVQGLSNELESKVVQTLQGPIRGYRILESDVFAFRGIPYASAPTGPNRFKSPLPPPTWTDTLDAIDKGIICPQPVIKSLPTLNKTMQEDCLIANVYVPNTEEINLPVAVSVHGGAFQIGYGDMVPTDKFSKNTNIITVTFNYRLGAYGFLCLGTESAPGNAGMKDQVALLKWVKNNIKQFGGNPDDVTILGCSAGGASVELLMLSNATDDLINKAIPESGASVGIIAIQQDPIETAKHNAKLLNFSNVDDIRALEEFYKTIPIEKLVFDDFWDSKTSANNFVPCVESKTGVDAFIDNSPINIIKSGKYKQVPMLYGFANMEGLIRLPYIEQWKNKMNEDFTEFLPIDLHFNNDEDKQNVIKSIKQLYFNDKPIDSTNVLGFIDYYTDTVIGYGMLKATKLYVEAGHDQLYLYEYSHIDDRTPLILDTEVRGATHCSQTLFILGTTMFSDPGENSLDDYDDFQTIMRQLWSNFIKTGKPVLDGSPVPSWPPAGHNRSPYMALHGPKIELKENLLEKRARFWDDVYDKYYRDPVSPRLSSTGKIEL